MNMDMEVVEEIRRHIEKKEFYELQDRLIFVTLKYPGILNGVVPEFGMSLFHMSVGFSGNETSVVKVLMDHGADPNNTKCDDKVSPLHLSILYEFDRVLDFLLTHGGDPFVQDGEGKNCYELVEALDEPDVFKSILVKHTSFSALSSIQSEGSSRSSGGTNSNGDTFMTCLTSCSDPPERMGPDRTTNFFTEDEDDESVAEPMKRRYGFLSTIKEETSSVMNIWNSRQSQASIPNSTKLDPLEETRTPSPAQIPDQELTTVEAHHPLSTPMSTPAKEHSKEDYSRDNFPYSNSTSSSPTHSIASTPSQPPSPTNSEIDRLRAKMANLNMQYPVTATTYHTISKFMSPVTNQLTLSKAENLYSSELQAAIHDLSIVERLKYGDLKIEVAQDAASDSPKKNGKSYYNYVLLDPKVIKRINLSGDHLKSDVIKNSDKFRKFISAIFYIGKGCGKRPIKHLEDAKVIFSRKSPTSNDKIKRILEIWKSGQGVIVHSCFHHSPEREASVNEAAMIDAMGLKELSNLKKGSYSGEMVSKWNQKQKNQFGVFLLRTVFSLYAVSSGTIKEMFPQDV